MKASFLLQLAALAVSAQAHSHDNRPGSDLSKRLNDLQKYALSVSSEYTASTRVGPSRVASVASQGNDYVAAATELVKSVAPDATFRLMNDHYIGFGGIGHVYFKQTHHGIDIDNANFNVNVNPDGQVFSYGNSFHKGSRPIEKVAASDPVPALQAAVDTLGISVHINNARVETDHDSTEDVVFKDTNGAVSDPKGRLVYLVKKDGSLALTWRVETDTMSDWLQTYVDAGASNEVQGVVSFGSTFDANFEIYPWDVSDPDNGERQIVVNPWNEAASPFGWLSNGKQNYTALQGNNALGQANNVGNASWPNGYTPEAADLMFEFPYSPDLQPSDDYRNASATQLFYTVNQYHDLLYTLGFDEPAGNFQINNNGKGGKDRDYVFVISQDSFLTNTAAFFSTADGMPGRLIMFMFDNSDPVRDPAFDTFVTRHEYTHGLSSRLTGGPDNPNCLAGTEANGLSEGWSDFMALATVVKSSFTRKTDYGAATWASNSTNGARHYPYSTNLKVNPLTYASLNDLTEAHYIGEVWCNTLYEVFWNIVDKHGMNDNEFPAFDGEGVPTDGRFLTMKLIMGGLALQPCNPDMIAARDAIIDADKALTGGANKCEIWKGFAKRGFGAKAKSDGGKYVENYKVPSRAC